MSYFSLTKKNVFVSLNTYIINQKNWWLFCCIKSVFLFNGCQVNETTILQKGVADVSLTVFSLFICVSVNQISLKFGR